MLLGWLKVSCLSTRATLTQDCGECGWGYVGGAGGIDVGCNLQSRSVKLFHLAIELIW